MASVCDLIDSNAKQEGLSGEFFARLIWKEDRFDPNAFNLVGVEDIAKCMLGTATISSLTDEFYIDKRRS